MIKTFFKIILPLLCITLLTRIEASELTIRSESSFIPNYSNRFSFMAGVNPSNTKPNDMSNITLSYGKGIKDYWIDTNFAMNKGLSKKFSTNNKAATGASDSQLEETQNSLTTLGIGIARETRYSQNLLPFDNMYELMAANLTYNSYKENFSEKNFSGPGLLAKFSVYKRFSNFFSAGAHFNYNLAVLKRAQEIKSETSSERSLTLGFLTVGIDLSIYL